MKALLVGIGAAGNKAVIKANEMGVIAEKDSVMINSTSKDFPKDFNGTKLILSPKDSGCGKERSVAKDFTTTAIRSGKLTDIDVNGYTSVIICTSVEGGTGSGATPMIAQYFHKVCRRNVHVIAFTGFEDDVRGLGNTIEFFQELDSNLIVQTISNKKFMQLAGNNKFKAEDMANAEMCKRIEILTGQNFIASGQNIDDTDILKVSNTCGYMTVEQRFLEKPLIDQEDFNRIVKKMIYESKTIQSNNSGAARMGVILNISPSSEDAIDYSFTDIKASYGYPYECFLQSQWDGKKEYIAFIISGMKMPIDEIKEVYNRYEAQSALVNKSNDLFFKELNSMNLNDEDKKFDMIKNVEHGMSIDDFMKEFETK